MKDKIDMNAQDNKSILLNRRKISLAYPQKYRRMTAFFFSLFVGGFIVSMYLWNSLNGLEKPVQYEILPDGALLSTTLFLSRFDKQGNLVWRQNKIAENTIRGEIRFDIDSKGYIFLFSPFGYYINNQNSGIVEKRAIEVLSPNGSWINSIGNKNLSNEFSLEILNDDNILVVDTCKNMIQLFSHNGKALKATGGECPPESYFRPPSGAAMLEDGTILVSDPYKARILRFNKYLTPLEPIKLSRQMLYVDNHNGSPIEINSDIDIAKNHLIRFPGNIVVDKTRGRIYVAMLNSFDINLVGHIAVFDMNMIFLGRKTLMTKEGEKVDPSIIRMSPSGSVTVVDSQSYLAGEWNPDDNIVVPPLNIGVRDYANIVNGKASLYHKCFTYGCVAAVIGMIGLIALTIASKFAVKRVSQSKAGPLEIALLITMTLSLAVSGAGSLISILYPMPTSLFNKMMIYGLPPIFLAMLCAIKLKKLAEKRGPLTKFK